MIADPATAHALHAVFEALALFGGARLYVHQSQRQSRRSVFQGGRFAVLCGCLLGAAIGNKLVFWLEMPQLFQQADGWQRILAGQSVVGGLLGGLIGTEIAKALSGKTASTGDGFVVPVLAGIAVGRVGCFLAGLHDGTFGRPTALPWGIDFGDGIPRHPTQLYEILFVVTLAGLLQQLSPRLGAQPGLRFKLMLSAYLLWRLLIDGLKPLPYAWPFGLSGIQWVCTLALSIYLPLTIRQWRQRHVTQEPPLPVL